MKWTDENGHEPDDYQGRDPRRMAADVDALIWAGKIALAVLAALALIWLLSIVGYGCGA